MNATIYLFGRFNNGYSQYPEDYTKEIFEEFHANAKSVTQLAIHRDGNLMYYGYIRKLEQDRYLGLCAVLNGMMLTHIEAVFAMFETTISSLVSKGQLIHFNDQGDLVTSVDKLYLNREEVELLSESLRVRITQFEHQSATLPAVSYSTDKRAVKNFLITNDNNEIVKSGHTNGFTYVYKSKGYNTTQMNSYKGVLARVNKEKTELAIQLEKLQTEHAKTLRQKKQFKIVLILFAVLLVCAFGLLSLRNNLAATRNALINANENIDDLNGQIVDKSTQISSLQTDNASLDQLLRSEKREHAKTKSILDSINTKYSSVCVGQKLIIKSTSYNFGSGNLYFNYYGLVNETLRLTARAYDSDGTMTSNSSYVHIMPGENSGSIYVDRYLDSEVYYTFVLLVGDNVIGGGRH